MFIRLLLLISLATTFTLAYTDTPTPEDIARAKKAISENPQLLDTQEAKAEMAKRGVTKSEVKQKLANSSEQAKKTLIINELKRSVLKIDKEEDVAQDEEEESTNESSQEKDDEVSNEEEDEEKDKEEDKEQKKIAKKNSKNKDNTPFTYKTNSEIHEALKARQQNPLSYKKLHRYSRSFYANKNKLDTSSLPTPDNYIMSVGDILTIHIYGDRDDSFVVTIKNDGKIDLAYIGPIKLGGMKFIDAKKYLIENLKKHFKTSEFSVNIEKYSTIQVTLIGDVKYPGLYNLSSFATVKDLLIVSNGIRESTSVRDIVVKREGRVIAHIDFYDLLFRGKSFTSLLLKHGDLVVINKAKKLVSIDGAVNNKAIFELKDQETLKSLIDYAGGMSPNASKREIKISRYDNNLEQKSYKISYKKSEKFKMKDGDRVYIYPLDYSSKNSVQVYGNIIRPGEYHLNKEHTLNAFFKDVLQYGKEKFFLPNTYFKYGVIKHYGENLQYNSYSFNLLDVIEDKQTIPLLAGDEIYIYAYNDIYRNTYIFTKGELLTKAGKIQFIKGITIKDALNASGINGILDDKVRVTTYSTKNLMPKTTFYSLKDEGNTTLKPYDEVEVFDYYDMHLLTPVTIKGEVLNPTTVAYEQNMSVADLVDIAGGFTPKAYKRNLEIVRYKVNKDEERERVVFKISTTQKPLKNIILHAYDEVQIFKIPKWNERKSVTLKGEVKFPGTYSIESGEKLSSVLKRAGGFTHEAFIKGTVFTRESIKARQKHEYKNNLTRLKRQLSLFNAMPANMQKNPITSTAKLDKIVEEAVQYTPLGRVSIDIDRDLSKFEKSKYNLVLKDKDTITIPSQIDTVTLFGEVFNPISFVYNDELDGSDYIELASGYTQGADKNSVYVIHADGTSEPIQRGWWIFSFHVDIQKGDTIVVPLYIQEYSKLKVWDSVSKIMASFALTAASLSTLGLF